MLNSIYKLYKELTKSERTSLNILVGIVFITALIQVIGVASIFPFIAVVANPDIIETNAALAWLKLFLGIEDTKQYLIVVGAGVLGILVITNIFMAVTTWLTIRFTIKLTHDLSYRMLQSYLHANYLFHLRRNSAELLKNLTQEVYRAVNGGILNAILVGSKGLSVMLIIVLLIYVDPTVALFMSTLLGGSYLIIYLFIQKRLKHEGISLSQTYSDRARYINESLGGIKELKVLGRENLYLSRFRSVSNEQVKYQIFSRSASELPKYFLETISVGGILAFTIYLIGVKNDISSVLPVISLYAFAGYRLMPSLQGVFQGLSLMRADAPAINSFYEDIKGHQENRYQAEACGKDGQGKEITFNESFKIENISFRYPNTTKLAIDNLSMTIKANTSIGIVGKSGSGKSTLVDIILGLINPQKGALVADDLEIDLKSLKAWQKNIGYVPQVIFLSDSTIRENIAFGLLENEVDQDAVEKAAKMAHLHDFIISELENGYDTIVGERGVRLSGGQRQRIGIARALYHNPTVLILDEATSALDTPTEQSVMNAVYSLAHKKTLIMVAHRISTIKLCDNIFVFENGQIRAQGTYDYLIDTCEYFRQLAHVK